MNNWPEKEENNKLDDKLDVLDLPDDGFGWIGMSEGEMIGCMGRDSACHGCSGRSVAVNVCRDWMSVLAARWHLYHRGEGSLAAGSWRGWQARQNTRTVATIAETR